MSVRLGGPFPFGQNFQGVQLFGGGIYMPPAGSYIVAPGAVTVLQFFDGLSAQWRTFAAPGEFTTFETDGFNWRLLNFSGIVQACNITNAGSGGTNGIGSTATGVNVSFGAAPANGRAAVAFPVVGGAINTTVTITQAGSGFVAPPALVFSDPPQGGVRATGRCKISTAGVIASVTVDNPGAGYTTAPTCYIVPQPRFYQGLILPGQTAAAAVPAPGLVAPAAILPGSGVQPAPGTTGALLTVNPTLTGSGTLLALGMLDYGAEYTGTTIPTITISGAGAAAATAVMALSVTSVTLGAGGAGYGAGAVPSWQTSMGDILTTVRDSFNNTINGRPARGITTVGAGAVATFIVEDPGFGLQSVPNVSVINTSALATGQATGTAVCGGIADTTILIPSVN